MNKFFDKIVIYLWMAVLGVVLVVGVYATLPKFRQRNALQAEHARILKQIENRRNEIAALRECKNRFKTDREFVEMLARKNHRLFPGEVVFVFNK